MTWVPAGQPRTFSSQVRSIADGAEAKYQVHVARVPRPGQAATWEKKAEGTVPVTRGAVSFEWNTEGPPTAGDWGQRYWRARYDVSIPQQGRAPIQAQSQEVAVFHDWVELTTLDAEGQPLPNVRFNLNIVVGGRRVAQRRNLRTDAQGVLRVNGLQGGDVGIEFVSPFVLVSWESGTGCVLRARVRQIKRARFVYPRTRNGRANHKQYVNLPDVAGGAPRDEGQRMRFKLKLDDGKSGDKIFFKVEFRATQLLTASETAGEQPFQGLNPRNDVTRPSITGGATPGWAPQGGKEVTLSADGEQPEVVVDLGPCGGDQFTFKIGGDERCGDDTVVVTNWRKVYYQVMAPAGMALGNTRDMHASIKGRMASRLGRAFIEWSHHRTHTFPDANAPAGSLLPKSYFRRRGRGNIFVLTDRTANATPAGVNFDASKDPRCIKLRLCNLNCFFDPGAPPGGAGHAVSNLTVNATSADFLVSLPAERLRDMGRLFLLESAMTGGDLGIRSIRWRATVPTTYVVGGGGGAPPAGGGAPPGGGGGGGGGGGPPPPPHPGLNAGAQRTGTFTGRAQVAPLITVVDAYSFRVALPRPGPGDYVGAAVTDTECPVELTLQLELASDTGLGLNQGSGAVLAVYSPDIAPNVTADVIAHEVGHQIHQSASSGGGAGMNALPSGLVRRSVPAGTAYVGYGHQGPHCAYGIRLATRQTVSSTASPAWDASRADQRGTCIMFGQNNGPDPSFASAGFCPDCARIIQAKNLSSVLNPT